MKKPFFAKYLEAQEPERSTDKEQNGALSNLKTGVQAGRTLKFPSDRDEDVTLKYPSDNDEGGVDV